MKSNLSTLAFILILFSPAFRANGQETFPTNGAPDKRHSYYAFTNARIVVDPQTTIEKGTLLIKDGLIADAAASVDLPKGTVVYDLKGKSIYPSLIDLYTTYGMPEVKRPARFGRYPQMESNTKGAYGWNQAIRPETEADKLFNRDGKSAEEMRKLGFGSALSFQKDGIARGSAVFVSLADERENDIILKDKAAAMYSFDKGSSTQDYPSSLMGSIALLRQTYYDAEWYKGIRDEGRRTKDEYNISLEAWNRLQGLPQIFEVSDKLSALRADKVGDEFKIQYILKGSGDEYQRMDEIRATNARFILPLKFPSPYDVEDPYDASLVSYSDLKHWEMAPMNPAAFEKKGIPFALTTDGLKDKKEFWKNLRKSIEYGLSEKTALQALTTTPAEMLGMQNQIGSLKKGMIANFIITSGNLFDEKTTIYENWVQGKPYALKSIRIPDLRGNYQLTLVNLNPPAATKTYRMKISGDAERPKAEIGISDSSLGSAEFNLSEKLISIEFTPKGTEGSVRLSGSVLKEDPFTLKGEGQTGDGTWTSWTATYQSALENKKDTAKKEAKKRTYPTLDDVIYPFNAYGQKKSAAPVAGRILIKNATVWTNEADGILANTDVYIQDGKIAKVGKNLEEEIKKQGGAYSVVDATGKYLTPGIIDEHSHLAISKGVNEGAQASSAEVRIGDVIDCDDINIYRNLAGGVVAAQLLHGSANPIGGQSGIVKMRWGKSPEEMKIQGADGYIKFALGENVKQSNWGENMTQRFPQTRMGTEQVYYDYFTRAKEYDVRWKAYQASLGAKKGTSAVPAPRRDLELETIAEILNKKRFITCHSYVQSEINMLMHVGDSMGFKVNTFTHILEGYKVADKMKARGIGASTFSDWWAYKMEVRDAIPYNGAIMYKVGLTVAFNSDDAEMSRRLNQEAAKAIKYGGVPEEDALKFVTLNPAKLLHLDNTMGSIKAGKSADVVLWSDHPLSIYAKAEKTIVDGQVYFDRETDQKLRDELRTERARIIQLMIQAKKGGEPAQKVERKEKKEYHCND